MTLTRRATVLAVAAAALTVAAGQAAQAHVQVRPAQAAPGDSVMFEVLVPGEREARTVELALQVPEGVLPFSFEETPGWRRQLELADDESIDVIRWRGRMDTDGFARFSFLAAVPEEEGDLQWKAVQTYDDGDDVAWIGPEDSEEPAPVTAITADAPSQNAGGESAVEAARGEDQAATPTPTPTAAAEHEEAAAADGDDGNTAGILLGGAGLVLGTIALVVALRGRRRQEVPPLRPDTG